MRVWLGNQQLFDEWRPQTPSGFSARIRLTAGEYYPLRVEYYQLGYQGQARLTWEPPTPDRAQARNLFGLLKTEPEPISPRFLVARVPPPPVAAPSATSPAPHPVPPAPAVAVSPRARVPPTSTPPAAPQPVVRATPPPTPARPRPTPTPAAVPAQPTTADLGTLAKGTTLEVQNLYFEQSRAVLLPTSEPAIAQLAVVLMRYPHVALEIAGHTENIGEPAANQRLSEQRARHIRALLIARGVDSTRLTAVGYGGTRPVINSPEPLKRARNRRVEVIVR